MRSNARIEQDIAFLAIYYYTRYLRICQIIGSLLHCVIDQRPRGLRSFGKGFAAGLPPAATAIPLALVEAFVSVAAVLV
jgi:hypothetical protein